jgi:hypothetical protein
MSVKVKVKTPALVCVCYAKDANNTIINFDAFDKNDALKKAKSFAKDTGGNENFQRAMLYKNGKLVGKIKPTAKHKLIITK